MKFIYFLKRQEVYLNFILVSNCCMLTKICHHICAACSTYRGFSIQWGNGTNICYAGLLYRYPYPWYNVLQSSGIVLVYEHYKLTLGYLILGQLMSLRLAVWTSQLSAEHFTPSFCVQSMYGPAIFSKSSYNGLLVFSLAEKSFSQYELHFTVNMGWREYNTSIPCLQLKSV